MCLAHELRRTYGKLYTNSPPPGARFSTAQVKFLLDNQIVPDGTVADPLTCANESYVYALNRYEVDTGKFSLIYVAKRADFPAPEKWTAPQMERWGERLKRRQEPTEVEGLLYIYISTPDEGPLLWDPSGGNM